MSGFEGSRQRSRLKRLAGAAWLGLALSSHPVAQADEFDRVREQIRDVMTQNDIPSVAVAVARNGKVLWEDGFGFADVERRIPATPHTLYSLASISKPFTTTALMILVERGLVDLDRPINDYLGEHRLTAHVGDARDATVRRVANHTAGLPEYYQFIYEDEAAQRPTMPQSIDRYGLLMRSPGEICVYSNLGYGVLEYVIERVSGQSYAAFLHKEIFAPLGMRESAVNGAPQAGGPVAVRYMNGRPVPFYDFDHRGSSAVFASAHDLVRFGMFHLQDRLVEQKPILSPQAITSMRERSVFWREGYHYSIGWILEEKFGLSAFGHTGGMAGVSTSLLLIPERDLAIALLMNIRPKPGPMGEMMDALLQAVLPETIRQAHGFRPGEALAGRWRGTIQSWAGKAPVQLDIRRNGQVVARVGEAVPAEVVQVRQDGAGFLELNEVPGGVGTADAGRYPYRLKFRLKQRGDVLNGDVLAESRPLTGRLGNALPYWVELRKIATDSEAE